MFLSDDFMDFYFFTLNYCVLKIQFVDTLHCCIYQLIGVSGNKIVIRLIQFSWSHFVQNLAFDSDIIC
jgi:hypothetical protein